ncbi:hypothetical protein BDZ89DRAFT_1122600 [Hymenopellis radicata]|nr:hypothetical protein BDZ89DRAFT_1122600 [Hymenopellis radicata]
MVTVTSSAQKNLAGAIKNDSEVGLEVQMTRSGGKHRDIRDSPIIPSAFFGNSRAPADYEGGRIHFLELGLYARLIGPTFFLFSGLYSHAGTAARAPPGATTVSKTAIRDVLILYPSSFYHDGRASFTFAAGVDQSWARQLRPEHTHPKSVARYDGSKNRLDCNETNFVRDGPGIMSRPSLMNFAGRGLLQDTVSVLRQIPGVYKVQVAQNDYLHSISYEDENDPQIRHTLDEWPLAPSVASEDPLSNDAARAKAVKDYDALRAHEAASIPFCRHVEAEKARPCGRTRKGKGKRAGSPVEEGSVSSLRFTAGAAQKTLLAYKILLKKRTKLVLW